MFTLGGRRKKSLALPDRPARMFAKKALLLPYLFLLALFTACPKNRDSAITRTKIDPVLRNNYILGEVVWFGEDGTSDRYKGAGWAPPEEDFTWTNASSAILEFSVGETVKPLELHMQLAGYVNRNDRYQHVNVIVNDEKVAEWQVVDRAEHVAVIPPNVANHEQLIVELRIPRAVSPRVIGEGADPRMLGVCCFELSITEER